MATKQAECGFIFYDKEDKMTSTTYLLRLIQVFMQKRYSREYYFRCRVFQVWSLVLVTMWLFTVMSYPTVENLDTLLRQPEHQVFLCDKINHNAKIRQFCGRAMIAAASGILTPASHHVVRKPG